MRHTTTAKYDEAVRQQCRECQGTKRMVGDHCEAKSCIWYDDRVALIERTLQLSIFTYQGFEDSCRAFLSENYHTMMSSMWWSDIRYLLTQHIRDSRTMLPPARWWSSIAQKVLPGIGWEIDRETRTSLINRARENRYTKIRRVEAVA